MKKYLLLIMLKSTINHFWKTKTILIKQWKIFTQQSVYMENTNIIDIKSVTIEQGKTFHKLFNAIRQAKE